MVNRTDNTTMWLIRATIITAAIHLRALPSISVSDAERLLNILMNMIRLSVPYLYDSREDKFGFITNLQISRFRKQSNPTMQNILEYDGCIYPEDIGLTGTSLWLSYNQGVKWVMDTIGERDGHCINDDNETMFTCAIVREFAHIIFDWFVLCMEMAMDEPADDLTTMISMSFNMAVWNKLAARTMFCTVHNKRGLKDTFTFSIRYNVFIDKDIKDRMVCTKLAIDRVGELLSIAS